MNAELRGGVSSTCTRKQNQEHRETVKAKSISRKSREAARVTTSIEGYEGGPRNHAQGGRSFTKYPDQHEFPGSQAHTQLRGVRRCEQQTAVSLGQDVAITGHVDCASRVSRVAWVQPTGWG